MTQKTLSDGPARPKSSGAHFQIRLSDLFFLIAFAACLALAFATKWTSTLFFFLTLGFGGIVGAVFVSSLFRNGYVTAKAVFSLLVSIFLLMCGFFSAGMMIFAHVIAALILNQLMQPMSRRTLTGISLGCVAVSMLLLNMAEPPRLQRLLQARAAYPIVDLSDRLQYESVREEVADSSLTQISLSEKVATRLNDKELLPVESRFSRLWALQKIHDQAYEEFVRSVGFGAVRMITAGRNRIDTPEIPTLGFEDEFDVESAVSADDTETMEWKYHLRVDYTDHDAPDSYHFAGEADFLHPATIGFVQSPKKAAGFLPHAFHLSPAALHDKDLGYKTWVLQNLELISLLRFDEPRAYVLDHLPRMDHLSSDEIPTRALTQFELTSLQELKTEKDVVIKDSGDKLYMLGSLRAGKSCIDCHSVKRGNLLGAFTYKFAAVSR